MAQKKKEIYSGADGMLYLRTDSGGIGLSDAVKELYGQNTGSLESQYADAAGIGSGDIAVPGELISQYSAARNASDAARAGIRLAEISAAEAAADKDYDSVAGRLYVQKELSEKAMANRLASAGLYNSGYSDTARLALENEYASGLAANEAERNRSADSYRLEKLNVLSELAAARGETDAIAAQLGLEQYNADREFRQKEREYADSREDVIWERKSAEQKYADARADAEWEREQLLSQAKTKSEQQALENAYAAAEIGDFSKLDALGIDTSGAKEKYRAELELTLAKLEEELAGTSSSKNAKAGAGAAASGEKSNGSASKENSGETDKSAFGTYERELAIDTANRLVKNMSSRNKTYSEVLQYVSGIRNGIVKQYGEEFWDTYMETISNSYPGSSGYTEPERLSSIASVMAFIGDSKNAARFFTDSGYNEKEIRALINGADISEAERNELRAYYGLLKTSSSGTAYGKM